MVPLAGDLNNEVTKKMFGKKGQGAMEYLMTYGWAILVVMIVGIVMWQLGIFNLGSSSVTSTGFSKIKPQLTSCKMTTAGVFSCLFTNGAGTAISVTGWNVNLTSGTQCSTSTTYANPINVGDNIALVASSCGLGTAGQAYSVNVYFAYTQSIAGTTVTHSDFGSVRGPYES